MSQTLKRCMTKATVSEGEGVRYSLNWLLSRRGLLNVTTDALECGDWRIPYPDIDEAVLFSVRPELISGYVLRVKSKGKIYQFGVNPGSFWRGELPFPVTREKAKLSYSWFSLVIRVVLVVMLIYMFWFKWR